MLSGRCPAGRAGAPETAGSGNGDVKVADRIVLDLETVSAAGPAPSTLRSTCSRRSTSEAARESAPAADSRPSAGFRIVAGRRARASRWRSAPAQARYPTTPLPSPTRRAIRLRLQADGVQPLGRRRPPRRISSRPSRPAPVNGSAGTGSTAELLVAVAVKEARSLPARSWSATSSSPGVGSA